MNAKMSSLVLKSLTYLFTLLTFGTLLFLVSHILVNGLPYLKPSLFALKYTSENVSMLPALITTVIMVLLSLLLAVPLGIFTAVYLVEYAKRGNKFVDIVRMTTETLSGIPSIVYGLFGMLLFVTRLGWGYSVLSGVFTLAIMILPTVVSISETSISAVPKEYREGSYALGASKIQTIFKVVLPAARSGIMTGVILGIGRAIGETMAVMLVCGNPIAGIPTSLFDQIRPLTTNIALEMGYASGVHQELLYSTGVVLFIFIMIINLAVNKLVKAKVGS